MFSVEKVSSDSENVIEIRCAVNDEIGESTMMRMYKRYYISHKRLEQKANVLTRRCISKRNDKYIFSSLQKRIFSPQKSYVAILLVKTY